MRRHQEGKPPSDLHLAAPYVLPGRPRWFLNHAFTSFSGEFWVYPQAGRNSQLFQHEAETQNQIKPTDDPSNSKGSTGPQVTFNVMSNEEKTGRDTTFWSACHPRLLSSRSGPRETKPSRGREEEDGDDASVTHCDWLSILTIDKALPLSPSHVHTSQAEPGYKNKTRIQTSTMAPWNK